METSSETKKALNHLLQGEQMSVEAFNIFISKTNDKELTNKFQQVQHNNRENIETISNYLQKDNSRAKESTGLKGYFAEMKLDMELGNECSSTDLLEKAIEGMTNGINMGEKVLRGNLDDESRELTGKILEKDRKSLGILKNN